jgi:hypothetical protein
LAIHSGLDRAFAALLIVYRQAANLEIVINNILPIFGAFRGLLYFLELFHQFYLIFGENGGCLFFGIFLYGLGQFSHIR